MSRYLEEAADLVRKAATANEQANGGSGTRANSGRQMCARMFALLAAIDKGLLPREMAGAVYDQFAEEPTA